MAQQQPTPRYVAIGSRSLGFWGYAAAFLVILVPCVLMGAWLQVLHGVQFAVLGMQVLGIVAVGVVTHRLRYGSVLRRVDARGGVMCTACGCDMRDHAGEPTCVACGRSWDRDAAREQWFQWRRRNRTWPRAAVRTHC